MTKLLIEVECGEKVCGKCHLIQLDVDGYAWCLGFYKPSQDESSLGEHICLNFSEMYGKRFKEKLAGDLARPGGSNPYDEEDTKNLSRCSACLSAERKGEKP